MHRPTRVALVSSLLAVLILAGQAFTAPSDPLVLEGPVAPAFALKPLATVPVVAAQPFDREALRLEDLDRAEQGLPVRFALAEEVFVTPGTGGTWEELDRNFDVWRLRVQSPGALSLNFTFGAYRLPKGARLTIHPAVDPVAGDERGLHVLTDRDNKDHGQLWSPLVRGDDVVLELVVPKESRHDFELALTSVNRGYRIFGEDPAKAGYCNIDVICPEGDDWREEIASVGVYTIGGTWACTGAVINNTAEDGTPYFLTAYHCGVGVSQAPSVVVYWNFESPTCGQLGGGSLADNQAGTIFRSALSSTDFTLLELSAVPDAASEVSYAGWNRLEEDYPAVIAIHHPNTDEKAISFEDDPTMTTSYLGTAAPGDGTHVRVVDWDLGTTEPGSSGSPLFDPDHRIVGQLHGGYAACGNDASDWYGRLSLSWYLGGTTATRLSDWLDPGGTGATTLDTYAPWATGLAVSPASGLDAAGDVGGPFTPTSVVYTLTNRNATPLSWSAAADVAWVDVTPASGTLAGAGTATVTVSLNAAADLLGQAVYTGTVSIFNLTDGDGDTTRPLHLQVGVPKPIYTVDMDTDPGWTTSGLWAHGVPTGGGGQYGGPDPTAGYTGTNVYGYNLAGDYENNLPERHLTSTAFDCSNLEGVSLRFQRWLGVEQPSYDHAYVSVSTDGTNFVQVWTNGGQVADAAWTPIELDIGAIADGQATVYVRWTMGITDGSWQFCGWNLDDVEIWGLSSAVSAAGDAPASALRLASHPNPFNPATTLVFAMERPGHAVLEVYDLAGRKVASLVNESRPAGEHRVTWQPRNLASGVYFARLATGDRVLTQRVTLLK